ncbi:RagB/SusD family nutrient uptake outer membrane protein [Pontibacter qinzhouensis]|uniref:RagB/SusD family nutrient uptake outer membrane protein n=1 Tax=Pontibacter qinzhouensis TaxID=2603253 RepID=A0A5C8JJ15_9BACT|nr:RagB/SusD family nutrient uptake outer membrane protein [Pontibacter qinzhouensis]TXK37321.1 RagB/SusD family nutrient uptake outer membrane protein [Pontibacter qinzhouensis]
MKIKNSYKVLLFTLLTMGSVTGCKDFLEEENRQSLTDATMFNDPKAFDQLVANVYNRMRPATSFYELDQLGTDIYTRGEIINGINDLNDYVNLTSVNWALPVFWQNYYFVIGAANTTINRADAIAGLSAVDKARGLGEVKFMRAFSYFNLVEHFGPVPLVLNEIRTSQTDFARASEEAVYAQILTDLDEALATVDEQPAQFGRVSKDAVRHLKAKVLLTRGYKSFAASTDFADAAALAEIVIANHPLVADFASLFTIENQRNSEVIFSMLYGTNPVSRGVGNNRHLMFKFVYDVYPGMTRSTLYHRGMGPAPTPFFYENFEQGDKREAATIRRVLFAEVDSNDGRILKGDTAVYFPKVAWSAQKKASKKYAVINPGEYFTPNGVTIVQYPMFRKFDDPGVAYTNPGIDPEGKRDAYIFRSGETRLIAAEAYLKAGNATKAADHINALRARAGLTTMLTPEQVDIHAILNESARELAGEVSRWMSLKRTGTLQERVLAHNPHAALNKAIVAKHLFRPIPQSEVNVSGGSIAQNNGY